MECIFEFLFEFLGELLTSVSYAETTKKRAIVKFSFVTAVFAAISILIVFVLWLCYNKEIVLTGFLIVLEILFLAGYIYQTVQFIRHIKYRPEQQ